MRFGLSDYKRSPLLQRAVWWATVVGALLWGIITSLLGIFSDVMPVIVTIGFAIKLVIGELGAYPFHGRQLVRHKVAFYADALLIVVFLNMLLDGPAASWYPTDSSLWILLSLFLYGLVAAIRGWGMEWRGRADTPSDAS